MSAPRALGFSVSVRRLPLARLGACLRELESAGVNEFKVDVCDANFAPGFALGFEIVEAMRDATQLPIHAHLLAERPERYIADFARLNCAALTVPVEACTHAHRTFAQIREAGLKPGVGIFPGTPLTALEYILPLVDRVVLSVGDRDAQPSPAAFERTRILRENVDYQRTGAGIAVEGNLRAVDAARLTASGADTIVIDRLDVLRADPLDVSVRAFIDAVAKSRKTA
jgi:ribulose-phosphate 3-epimerase